MGKGWVSVILLPIIIIFIFYHAILISGFLAWLYHPNHQAFYTDLYLRKYFSWETAGAPAALYSTSDIAFMLATNRTAVDLIGEHVFANVTSEQMEVFRHDPIALAKYLVRWVNKNIYYVLYYEPTAMIPDKVFQCHCGKCTDIAYVMAGSFIYVGYNETYLIDIPNHLMAGFKYHGKLYALDAGGGDVLGKYLRKFGYPESFPCEHVFIYRIYRTNTTESGWIYDIYNACGILKGG